MIGNELEPLRIRMSIYSSNSTKTEVDSSNGSNNYLYDNLDPNWHVTGDPPS